jgi:hypothetical protein
MTFDNTIEHILELMQNDTEDTEKQSDMLEFFYENCDEKGQKLIDTIMINLCGYSLDKIINHPDLIPTGDGE